MRLCFHSCMRVSLQSFFRFVTALCDTHSLTLAILLLLSSFSISQTAENGNSLVAGGASCGEMSRQSASLPPSLPNYTEIFLEEGRKGASVCKSYRLYTIMYSSKLDSEGLCITAASAAEHGYIVNVLGLGTRKDVRFNSLDRLWAIREFVAKVPEDAIVLHVSLRVSLSYLFLIYLLSRPRLPGALCRYVVCDCIL